MTPPRAPVVLVLALAVATDIGYRRYVARAVRELVEGKRRLWRLGSV